MECNTRIPSFYPYLHDFRLDIAGIRRYCSGKQEFCGNMDERFFGLKLCGWGFASGDSSIRVKNHSHGYFQANFTVSGTCVMTAGDSAHTLRPGSLIFLSPGVSHTLEYPEPYLGYSFKFTLPHSAGLPAVLHVPAGGFTRGVLDAVRTILDSTFPAKYYGVPEGAVVMPGDRYPVLLEYYLAGVLDVLTGERLRYSGPLAAVCDVLEKNPGRYVSVKEAAAACSYSRNHFSLLVKRASGRSARDFLNGLRLESAERYLRYSTLNIGEISRKLGFSSQFHFSEFFRRMKGIPPIRYRESLLRDAPPSEK